MLKCHQGCLSACAASYMETIEAHGNTSPPESVIELCKISHVATSIISPSTNLRLLRFNKSPYHLREIAISFNLRNTAGEQMIFLT